MRGGGDEGGWGVGVSLPANPHHSAGRWTLILLLGPTIKKKMSMLLGWINPVVMG